MTKQYLTSCGQTRRCLIEPGDGGRSVSAVIAGRRKRRASPGSAETPIADTTMLLRPSCGPRVNMDRRRARTYRSGAASAASAPSLGADVGCGRPIAVRSHVAAGGRSVPLGPQRLDECRHGVRAAASGRAPAGTGPSASGSGLRRWARAQANVPGRSVASGRGRARADMVRSRWAIGERIGRMSAAVSAAPGGPAIEVCGGA